MAFVHHLEDLLFFGQIVSGIPRGELPDGLAVVGDIPVLDRLGKRGDTGQTQHFQAVSFSPVQSGAKFLFITVGEVHDRVGDQDGIG